MDAIETLISVLCDPEGKCCISGSDDDRRLIDSALADLAAAPAQPAAQQGLAQQEAQEPATVPRFNCWSTNEGDSWFDHPADSQAIYDCLGNDAKVGDEYELTAGWKSVTARYRITEVVGDGEEYEVECISHPHENSAPQPPTAQAEESVPAPPPPPECETEAEKRAFAFGWFKALESERMKADSVQEDAADPLQGAANWLAEAHGQFSPVVLSGCLMIGYNRAKRLHDAALAARKQGENHDHR